MPKKQRRQPLSHLDETLLLVLSQDKEMYGLEILKQINAAREKANIKPLHQGSAYPTLTQLEKAGHVTSHYIINKGARCRYFTITDKGKEVLAMQQLYRSLLLMGEESTHP